MREKNIVSYANILESRNNFRKIYNNPYYNPLDQPATFYFKIMFYFNNPGSVDSGYLTSNLLGLNLIDGLDAIDDITEGNIFKKITGENSARGSQYGSRSVGSSLNTAYNFLMINDELERAEMLKDFIFLLSEISSESPWYFKSIEGLDSATDRSYLKEFKLEDKRTLTINCLQESIDTRITTLLELYKGACFSHIWRKEIVPANLRKFDMGVFIFQAPTNGDSLKNVDRNLGMNTNTHNKDIYTDCKYFEFHNCEIDLESLKSCYGSPDNGPGFAIEPKIIIGYDNCIVSSYNEDLCMMIGDLVQLDMNRNFDAEKYIKELRAKRSDLEISSKLADTIIDNTLGKGITKLKSLATKALLGNVYGFSIRNMMGSAEQMLSGDLIGGTAALVQEGIKTGKAIGNGSIISNVIPSLVSKDLTSKTNSLGNIGTKLLNGISPSSTAAVNAARAKKAATAATGENIYRNK